MDDQTKHLSLRIDAELLAKFRFAAKYNERSANSQFLIYAREYVRAYEKAHGKISQSELDDFMGK